MSDHRFYTDLAPWWPLLSPPEEYAEEAAFLATLLGAGEGRELLELGSGGGHNAVHLAPDFTLTLADLSADMLAVSRRLNPAAEHVQGDMRTLRLGRTFDAVLIHDAVGYMTTEDDLRRAVATAYAHCRPGGRLVIAPDATTENFRPGTGCGGTDAPDGRGARYLEWEWDPDPTDTWTLTVYAFVLREADGTVRCLDETHRTGLFPRAVWRDVLTDAGFEASSVIEPVTDRTPRELFLGRRPAG
ncbi:class I SAM-dependent methyltransferase [Georgenia wangjunii]|uniref:class I SAM-dependent methyltransferase n=1 Tax=Georgenia wangjunii TaxID=3117730 RepID=UPI002F2602EB